MPKDFTDPLLAMRLEYLEKRLEGVEGIPDKIQSAAEKVIDPALRQWLLERGNPTWLRLQLETIRDCLEEGDEARARVRLYSFEVDGEHLAALVPRIFQRAAGRQSKRRAWAELADHLAALGKIGTRDSAEFVMAYPSHDPLVLQSGSEVYVDGPDIFCTEEATGDKRRMRWETFDIKYLQPHRKAGKKGR